MRDPSATNLRNGARPPMHATAQVLVHSTITSHGPTYRPILISEHTTSHKHSKGYCTEGSDIIRPLTRPPARSQIESDQTPLRGFRKAYTAGAKTTLSECRLCGLRNANIGCLPMQSTGKIHLDAATNAALKRPPQVWVALGTRIEIILHICFLAPLLTVLSL